MLAKHRSRPRTEDEPIGVLVAAVRRSIKQATGLRLRGSGLAPQQFWILMAVHEHPELSLRGLCELRRMDAPTASRVVATLAVKGLLRIGDDHDDRRRCRLALTPQGAVLARRLEPLLHELRHAIVLGFSPAEQATLRTLLLRLIANSTRMEQSPGRGARVTASQENR